MKHWEKQALAMREAASIAELVERHGEPAHKETAPGMEIWHYPLGVADGKLHSIHVSVFPDRTFQVYMHMEPAP
jgi:hypothetical protein